MWRTVTRLTTGLALFSLVICACVAISTAPGNHVQAPAPRAYTLHLKPIIGEPWTPDLPPCATPDSEGPCIWDAVGVSHINY